MKIETTTKLSHPTLVLRGEFDTEAAARFLEAVKELREDGGTRVMVSLRYVKYLNSTALGAIVRARTNCQEDGGDLIILQPSRLSRDIITKMGLDSVLRIFDDEVEAAGYLGGDRGPAEAAPTNPATDDSDETVVMFSFDDERSKLIPGKSRHGVGVLDSVDSSSLVFRWNPAKHDSDEETAAAMFTPGSTMRNKLQIKLIRKGFFEANSTIESLGMNEFGDVTVNARWSSLAPADREALARYHEDMSFLKKQVGE